MLTHNNTQKALQEDQADVEWRAELLRHAKLVVHRTFLVWPFLIGFILHELGLYMVRDVVEIDGYGALIEKVDAFHADLCVLCDSFLPWLFRF